MQNLMTKVFSRLVSPGMERKEKKNPIWQDTNTIAESY